MSIDIAVGARRRALQSSIPTTACAGRVRRAAHPLQKVPVFPDRALSRTLPDPCGSGKSLNGDRFRGGGRTFPPFFGGNREAFLGLL